MVDVLHDDVRYVFMDMDGFRYPQPLVAHVVNLLPSCLNDWRNRGLLDGCWVSDGSRVLYSLQGLFAAGIMSELAWAVGPSKARYIAKWLGPELRLLRSDAEDEARFNARLPGFQLQMLVLGNGEDVAPGGIRVRDTDDLASLHFTLTLENREAFDVSGIRACQCLFAFGAMTVRWAVSARLGLAEPWFSSSP